MRLIILFVCCSLISTMSNATDTDRIHKFINFIVDNTELEYNGEPVPSIHFATHEEMCAVLYTDPPSDCNIAGYYNDDLNQIWIATSPTKHMVAEGFQDVVLVHELVHFLQKINGVYETIECRKALERDAFAIQEQFVDEAGLPERQKPDPLFSLIVSACHPQGLPMWLHQ